MHKMAVAGGQNYWPMIFLRVDQVCRVSLLFYHGHLESEPTIGWQQGLVSVCCCPSSS